MAIGDLTTSGILYEGSFAEWKSCIDAVLRLSRNDVFVNCEPYGTFNIFSTAEEAAANSKQVASLIQGYVSPESLERVPDSERSNGFYLMRCLKKHARPFRFLDLPPELRNRVYELVLPPTDTVHESRRRYYEVFWGISGAPNKTLLFPDAVDRYPPLTQTSRQLRAETLPSFYANAEMRLDFYPLDGETGDDRVSEQVQRWASDTVGCYAKHLRQVTIRLHHDCRYVPDEVSFRSSPGHELAWNVLCGLHAEGRELLDKHTQNIEGERQKRGFSGGEAIIRAIVQQPEIWQKGRLFREE